MHFKNLKEIKEREIIKGYKAKFIHSKNMTISYWDIEAGAIVPEHFHINEQAINVIEGKFELKIGGETKILGTGEIAIIPSNVKHSAKAITKVKTIECFYPVREDYVFN